MSSHSARPRNWLAVALACLLLAAAIAPATAAPAARVRPFALTDQDGHTVMNRDMLGRPYLIFFGFTHCADCTTLTEVSAILRQLGPDADGVGTLFVTVDPQRDTPKAMQDYLSQTDSHIRGLTGSVVAIDKVMKEYRIYHHKVAFPGGYAVEHTTTVYLVDKNGNFVGPFDVKQPPEKAAAALRQFF
jgi:protein SCO1